MRKYIDTIRIANHEDIKHNHSIKYSTTIYYSQLDNFYCLLLDADKDFLESSYGMRLYNFRYYKINLHTMNITRHKYMIQTSYFDNFIPIGNTKNHLSSYIKYVIHNPIIAFCTAYGILRSEIVSAVILSLLGISTLTMIVLVIWWLSILY